MGWTKDEDQILMSRYGEDSVLDIARDLGKPYTSVAKRASRLELSTPQKPHRWQDEELQYLRDHYQNQSLLDIAKALGRTINSVQSKAKEIRVSRTTLSDKIEYIAHRRREGAKDGQIGSEINRNAETIRKQRDKHHIP